MPIVSCEVPERDSNLIERLISEKRYASKSDIIRTALRALFEKEKLTE